MAFRQRSFNKLTFGFQTKKPFRQLCGPKGRPTTCPLAHNCLKGFARALWAKQAGRNILPMSARKKGRKPKGLRGLFSYPKGGPKGLRGPLSVTPEGPKGLRGPLSVTPEGPKGLRGPHLCPPVGAKASGSASLSPRRGESFGVRFAVIYCPKGPRRGSR